MFNFIFGRTIKVRPPIFTYKEVSEKLKNTIALSTLEAILMRVSSFSSPMDGKALRFKADDKWQEAIYVWVVEENYPENHHDHKEVIMMHEIGHLIYGHNQEKTGRLLEQELEADWFAAKVCGKPKTVRTLLALQAMRGVDQEEMKKRISFIEGLKL